MALLEDDTQVRVADYLDDKLQTAADLDALDGLLNDITSRHGLLKSQLDDAIRDLDEAKQASRDHALSVHRQSEVFSREQHDVARRLQILTASDTSDDAVPRFDAIFNKLQRLDEATSYVGLLREVERLSQQCQHLLQNQDGDALEPYRQLQSLASTLGPLQEAAEGAAPHLLDEVNKTVQNVYRQIKDAYSKEFDDVLHQIGWPKPAAVVPPTLRETWDKSIGKLLDLQKPELLDIARAKTGNNASNPPAILLPFEVLVQPLEMRFRYHFEGDKATNRLDKPEYFLQHVTELLNSYNGFILDYVQPVLLDRFRSTDLAFNPTCIDASSAFITALLPVVRHKVFSVIPKAATQPQLLSHYVEQLVHFDSTLRDEWRYDGGYGIQGWKGITWEILVTKDFFGRWLQVEKDFALARYQDILSSPDSGSLDYDSLSPTATKPTHAAIRVNDLLETITEKYRPLISFSQKLRFLMDIQISIFDRYHERLRSALEAYLTSTSTLGRQVQGISAEEQAQLKGVQGLDRLCRIYGSADYLERCMRDWSDDLFFLELWEELQDRARHSSSIGSSLSVSAVAEKTSSTVGTDGDGGALFDETAAAYHSIRTRTEGIIVEALNSSVHAALRPYTRINPWSTLPSSTASTSLPTPTAELDGLLTVLRTSLSFLSKAFSQVALRRVVRQVLTALQTLLWDGIINNSKHTFSTAGAGQLAADVSAICRVVDSSVGGKMPIAEMGLSKVVEGVRLVGLPVRAVDNKSGVEEPGEGEGADVLVQPSDDVGLRERGLGLWEVEKRLFKDNESARKVLEELGIEGVSEVEARAVLVRRVELQS